MTQDTIDTNINQSETSNKKMEQIILPTYPICNQIFYKSNRFYDFDLLHIIILVVLLISADIFMVGERYTDFASHVI